jgi:hypothetical protein
MTTLYVDDDGYICFRDSVALKGPGIFWTLHHGGWEAFINLPDQDTPIYQTGEGTFPTDDDLTSAAGAYEKAGDWVNQPINQPEDLWGEDKSYPRAEWQAEVANGDTQLGYWEWARHQRDANEPVGEGRGYKPNAKVLYLLITDCNGWVSESYPDEAAREDALKDLIKDDKLDPEDDAALYLDLNLGNPNASDPYVPATIYKIVDKVPAEEGANDAQ